MISPKQCLAFLYPGSAYKTWSKIIFSVMGLFVGELVSTQPMGYMGKVCEREWDPRLENNYDSRIPMEENQTRLSPQVQSAPDWSGCLDTPFQGKPKFIGADAGSPWPRSPPSDGVLEESVQAWNKKLIPRSKAIEDPTNPARWSCGCPHFINSRFLICKHLFFYEPISAPVRFFREVRRQRTSLAL